MLRLWEQWLSSPFKDMGTLLMRPIQGFASLSYPHTWVRKPDCLHFPYTHLRGEEKLEQFVKFTAQRISLTWQLRSNHGITDCLFQNSLFQNLTTALLKADLQKFFLLSTSCQPIKKKIIKHSKKAKKEMQFEDKANILTKPGWNIGIIKLRF